MTPQHAIYILWQAWLVTWVIAMVWAGRTQKRGAVAAELGFRLLLWISVILLFLLPARVDPRLWALDGAIGWFLAATTLLGLVFSWWARIHLGRLWSDWIVTKAGHRVVDSGPYRFVRHPIYSGLLLAALATAIAKGTCFAILGASIAVIAFYTKARREERFLCKELGRDAYGGYARKTPVLVPRARFSTSAEG